MVYVSEQLKRNNYEGKVKVIALCIYGSTNRLYLEYAIVHSDSVVSYNLYVSMFLNIFCNISESYQQICYVTGDFYVNVILWK